MTGMLDTIGWIATAVFSTSYFFRQPAALRRIQAAAACLWIIYGIALHAFPVIAANVIVAAAALVSSARRQPS
jgi:hypothetical protein